MANLGRSVEVHVYLDPSTGLVTPSVGDGLFTNPTGWSNPTASVTTNPDGTAALPGITFTSELSSGLYRIGAGDVGLSILGVKVAEFTAGAATIVQPLTVSGASVKVGTNPSTTGAYNMPNSTGIYARNAANSGDVQLITLSNLNVISLSGGNVHMDNNLDMLGSLSVGTTPATTGTIRIPTATWLASRNAGNTADINLIQSNASDLLTFGVIVNHASAASIALGAGAAPTLGTIGGSGPASAAQNSWLKVFINGTASYIPVWR